jgi:hypothetical protein
VHRRNKKRAVRRAQEQKEAAERYAKGNNQNSYTYNQGGAAESGSLIKDADRGNQENAGTEVTTQLAQQPKASNELQGIPIIEIQGEERRERVELQ